MNNIVIRKAAVEDSLSLATLDAAAWPKEFQVVPPRGADQPFFTEHRDFADVIVAEQAETIVGYVHLARHIPIEANAHVLHLNSLVVAPEARGSGLSHQLVAAAIDEARSRGIRKLGLRALSNNVRAVHLYELHGFQLEGRIADEILLPDGTYADDLWFALRLDA